MKPIKVGSVVLSIAGRDKSNYFLVYEIVKPNMVKLVDGKKHKLNNMKTKNIKHVRNTGEVIENLANKIENSQKIYNAEIYSALRKYNIQNGGLNV